MIIKSYTILFFIILSSVTLQTIGNLSYANEYLVVMLLLYVFIFKKRFGAPVVKTIMFFLVSAVYSYLIHSNIPMAILIDLTTILKPYLIGVLCAGLVVPLRARHKTILWYIFVTYMSYNWILFGVGGVGWHYGKSWELTGATPYWELAGSTVILFLFTLLYLNKNSRGMYLLLLCLLSLGVIACRQGKHMVFFAMATIVVLYFKVLYSFVKSKDIRIKLFANLLVVGFIAAGVVSALQLAAEDVRLYYMSGEHITARRAFLINLPDVLVDGYVWLGRGLASYGSQASGTYYSSLYYTLGMDHIYGLHEGNAKFVNDAYYAMYIGQLGIAGLFFQVFYWYYMLTPLWNCLRLKINLPENLMIATVLSVIWSAIFMLGSGLFNSQGCFVMCVLGFARSEIKSFLGRTG